MKIDLKEKMTMNDSLAFTRRQFLKTLGVAAMSVAGGAPVTGADPGAGPETPVQLSSIELKKHVGSTFRIKGPEDQIVAVLESVNEDRADDKLDQFTARFHLGRSVPGLNQDSYDWEFLPVAGTFADSGSGTCH